MITDADLARWEEKLRGAGTFHAVPPIAATDVLILLEEIRRLRAEPRLEITFEKIRTALDGLALAEHMLETLAAENERLLALLREVQWGADDDGAGCCPVCREGYPVARHAPDCRLAAALTA